jgi:hypothetical protein
MPITPIRTRKRKRPSLFSQPRFSRNCCPSTARLASGQGNDQVGEARAELLRRDQEYAEAQELSRREYEDDRAATRREFEERLMQRQMEHASRLAEEQLNTARAAARAAKWAAAAAAVTALGVIAQAIIAILK